jgi:hypothetical protein
MFTNDAHLQIKDTDCTIPLEMSGKRRQAQGKGDAGVHIKIKRQNKGKQGKGNPPDSYDVRMLSFSQRFPTAGKVVEDVISKVSLSEL